MKPGEWKRVFPANGDAGHRLASGFRALRHRDFRLFWIGQSVSLIGTWMQSVGQAWLILKLTDSPFQLGLVSAMQFLPVLVLSLFVGPLIDRLPKRDILILTQTSMLLQALALGLLVAHGSVQYWHVTLLAFMLGVANTLDLPARQAFIYEVVGKEDIGNAVALHSTVFNAARIVGPGLAGLAMAKLGIAPLFILNAVSFAAVIASLLLIPSRPPRVEVAPGGRLMAEVVDGLRYVRATRVIARYLVLMAIVSTFALNFNIFVPVYARNVLGGSAVNYGFLMSALGAGALLGAVLMAFSRQSGPSRTRLLAGAIGIGLFLCLLALNRRYQMALGLLFFAGLSMISFAASTNATIQVEALDTYRGRVMSLYTLVLAGVSPIGAIFTGTISDRFGAPLAIMLGGLAAFVGVAVALAWERLERKSATA